MNKLILPLLIGIPLVLGAAWIFLAGGKSGIASTRIEVVGPGFSAPIECVDPANCVIQNHFDLAEFAGVSDPSCGDRSYDGHGGLDFRILDLPTMLEGVPVRAAADGIVRRAHDGEFDGAWAANRREFVESKHCGNGVLLDHGDGFETLYCQLRRGSVEVADGEEVKRGEQIALVGMSGRAEFPHLHFEAIKDGKASDPFSARGAGSDCGGSQETMWQAETPQHWNANAGPFVFKAGFTDRPVTMPLIERGLPAPSRTSPAIVFYARSIWLRDGDLLQVQLEGPEGFEPVALEEEPVDGSKAQAFRFVGRPSEGKEFPAGRYQGRFQVVRGGEVVLAYQDEMELN